MMLHQSENANVPQITSDWEGKMYMPVIILKAGYSSATHGVNRVYNNA